MVWIVEFALFEAYLVEIGFVFVGSTERHRIYDKGNTSVVVRSPSSPQTLTVVEMEKACDAAGIDPPDLPQTFGAS